MAAITLYIYHLTNAATLQIKGLKTLPG